MAFFYFEIIIAISNNFKYNFKETSYISNI